MGGIISPSFNALHDTISTGEGNKHSKLNKALEQYKNDYHAIIAETEQDDEKLKALINRWLDLMKQINASKEEAT